MSSPVRGCDRPDTHRRRQRGTRPCLRSRRLLPTCSRRRSHGHGIDAAQALIEIARERVPDGHFDLGDLQVLPYEDDSFDVVTAFNRAGGRMGPRGTHRTGRGAARSAPPASAGSTSGAGSIRTVLPGALEALLERSGLTPIDDGYIPVTFQYADETAMLRGNGPNGPVVLAERTSGEAAVVAACRAAFSPYRTASGGYRIETEWRFAVARA